ncbi:MAG: DinB family protein [Bacteroidetes bacterium]|nr:DinB family protein [Bacteroidota bacterium]
MSISTQISKHFKEVNFGGNWTCSNLKDQLADVTWQEATTSVYNLNSIATLVYHISYFVNVAIKVLKGGPLEGKDELSFDHPPIQSKENWNQFLSQVFSDAETFTELIAQLPEEKLLETFSDEKYGNYYRNIAGIIEHTHYHLGQIAIIKKLIRR